MRLTKLLPKIYSRLASLSYQGRGMLSCLTLKQKFWFLALSVYHAKSLVKTDRFLSVDESFSKTIDQLDAKIKNIPISIPFRKMEEELDKIGNDGASLELVRELFGNNEYVRKFKENLSAEVTLDIGSNRGFFALVAHSLFKSKKIICVEPQKQLDPVRHLLFKANKIPPKALVEYYQFCSSQPSKTSITINQIMEENHLQSIDFLKMDVEGAEADIFSNHLEWLDRCKNISMEIHYGMANVGFIPGLLRSKGFDCILTDLRGQIIPEESTFALPRGCAYLYASSNGFLR